MNNPIVITHAKGAPGLRFLGLGPYLKPNDGVQKLTTLMRNNTSWASIRNEKDIKIALRNSSIVISVWCDNQMIGFGRATTDEIFRAVLWDVVVDKKYQNNGIGRKIIQKILENQKVSKVEKVYIMTTNCKYFYSKVGFKISKDQKLMLLNKN
tara:strand:- start:521 stop:979 length:459 start_codon:yes stop_codon:yes gene_type:complete